MTAGRDNGIEVGNVDLTQVEVLVGGIGDDGEQVDAGREGV